MTTRRAAIVFGAVGAGLVAASAGVAVVGGGIWWLVAATMVLMGAAVAARRGVALGVSAAVIGSVALLGASMAASAAVGVPMLPVAVAALALVALASVFALTTTSSALRRPTLAQLVQWLPTLTGTVVWLATFALCQVIPGAARLSWVTTGDSASYIVHARSIAAANGIRFGSGESPVPLPASLLALGSDTGVATVAASDLVAHELSSLATTWALAIALTALLAGVLAASTVGGARPRVAAVVAAGASLIPLSWLIGTYSAEYGFFNAMLALVVLLAALIVAFSAARAPALALGLLVLASVEMLVTWSPLVVIPAALAVHIAVENRREFWRMPRSARVALIVAVAAAAGYVALVAAPTFFAHRGQLAADGGYFPISMLLPAGVFLVGAVVVLVGRRVGLPRAAGLMITVLASSSLGVNFLLVQTGFAVSYYPQKFLWQATSMLIILEVALVAAILTRVIARRGRLVVAVSMLFVATGVALALAPTTKAGYTGWDLPAAMLTSGFTYTTEPLAEAIVTNSNPERPVYLWPVVANEQFLPNFWLLMTHIDANPSDLDLRAFAYNQTQFNSVDDLCDLAGAFDEQLTLETTDASLDAELASTCPDAAVSVVIAN